jgi:hypothetical protein
MSGGIPRLVNLLCDRALLGAFGRGLKVVDDDLIAAAASEVLPASRNAAARTPAWLEAIALFTLGLLVMLPLRSWLAARRDTTPPRATQSPATPAASPSTPERSIAPAATSAPTSAPTASVAPVASTPAPLADAVRCKVGPGARAAAIAAIEAILGTPGFDSAQATLTYDQWRASKIPAIAPFRTARGPCEAAIVSIDAKTVRVADDSGTYVMDHEALAAAYGGTAILCFVDRDDILTKSTADRLAWARKLLERRGLLPPGAPQTAFMSALGRIGASVGVKRVETIDGPVLAALYGLDSKHQTGGAR